MKILIISSRFYPQVVGSGTSAFLVAKQLHDNGWDVSVIADQEVGKLSEAKNIPFKMFYIDFLESYAMGESSFKKPTEQIYKILTDEKYDIVHVHNFMPMLLISIIRPLIKCPVIFTFHNTPNGNERAIGYYQNPKLDIQLAKSVINFQKYDRLVVGSQCYYDFAIKLGADPNLTTLSYFGIDHKEFEKNIEESSKVDLKQYFGNKLKKNDFLITLPGRITKIKVL